MKKIICLLIFIASSIANAQSFTVFDVDTTNFPTIKAKFYAFDADGKQITNLSLSDFEITENGTPRTVTNVSCPAPKEPEALSSVLVFDISGSMSYGPPRIESAKNAARAWVDGLPLGKSECALVSFSDYSFIIQDLTINRQRLINSIEKFYPTNNTNYNQALIDAPSGGLQVATKGKYKRVVIFLTDGLPNFEPKTQEIINFANQNKISIYAVTLDMPAPQCIKDMTEQTGGEYFENITTKKEAEDTYNNLLTLAQGGDHCTIEWQSNNIVCKSTNINVNMKCIPLNLTTNELYYSPNKSIAKLEINPTSVTFLNPAIGVKVEQKITVTAINSDFNVINITPSNPSFYITPTSFMLGKGESKELTVNYIPADSGFNYCKFTFENNVCQTNYYVSGGYKGIRPKVRTLKLLHPNGGEVFVAGIDTIISWEGIVPEEKVKIEYSTNNGTDWTVIAESATGLSYKWRVPKTPSNQCLARITAKTAKTPTIYLCNNPDVKICNKIWMGCNLNVETYRNGDLIPEVTDSTEWANLTTGAWCYYNNDPAMGAIYGKLYNCYALNDPRGLAPEGWHIPTDTEWTELKNCLGGTYVAGGKLKSIGTIEAGDGLWHRPNTGATNESGFSALPGGFRTPIGTFKSVSYFAIWSTSTNLGKGWDLYFESTDISGWEIVPSSLNAGYSVRCVKD